ncbi:MAG: hypothetical protein QGF92_02955 [Gammaproteobacteria bacterium]|nr:hypothetical protein [Gammaproteobacteria bacterium]
MRVEGPFLSARFGVDRKDAIDRCADVEVIVGKDRGDLIGGRA